MNEGEWKLISDLKYPRAHSTALVFDEFNIFIIGGLGQDLIDGVLFYLI